MNHIEIKLFLAVILFITSCKMGMTSEDIERTYQEELVIVNSRRSDFNEKNLEEQNRFFEIKKDSIRNLVSKHQKYKNDILKIDSLDLIKMENSILLLLNSSEGTTIFISLIEKYFSNNDLRKFDFKNERGKIEFRGLNIFSEKSNVFSATLTFKEFSFFLVGFVNFESRKLFIYNFEEKNIKDSDYMMQSSLQTLLYEMPGRSVQQKAEIMFWLEIESQLKYSKSSSSAIDFWKKNKLYETKIINGKSLQLFEIKNNAERPSISF